MKFNQEEKREILRNQEDYPNLTNLIKAQNKYEFEKEDRVE